MNSPDFDQIANMLVEEGAVAFSPAELHGVIVGQLSAGQRLQGSALNQFVAAQLDLEKIGGEANQTLVAAVYKLALEQLEAPGFELRLILPDDEQELALRAESLGLWAAGFLAGFGLGIGEQGQNLSTDAQDGLRDLVQIAQIESEGGAEEDESLLMEVEEYVRMAAMLLFSECNSATAETPAEQTVH